MRKKGTALTLVGLGALWLAGSPASTGDRVDDIRRATARMLQAGSGGPGDVRGALRDLIEIAGDLGREARLPSPTQAKLDAALDQGRSFVFPEEVGRWTGPSPRSPPHDRTRWRGSSWASFSSWSRRWRGPGRLDAAPTMRWSLLGSRGRGSGRRR
jgi:hypothetical protein